MAHARSHARPSGGFTLVELLVVIAILLILVVAIGPQLGSTRDDRRVREAARGIETYLGAARAQAMDSGRAVGVLFARDLMLNSRTTGNFQLSNACTALYQVEVPPLYSGDTLTAACTVVYQAAKTATADKAGTLTITIPAAQCTVNSNDASKSLINANDAIRLNYRDPTFPIQSVSGGSGSPATVTATVPQSALPIPWTTSTSQPMPFQVIRAPVRSSAATFVLPTGTAVDLSVSGNDAAPLLCQLAANTSVPNISGVTILFQPDGSVDTTRVYVDQTSSPQPEQPLCFLVGMRHRIADSFSSTPPSQDEMPNWGLPNTSLWLSITPSTGLIRGADNYAKNIQSNPTAVAWTNPARWNTPTWNGTTGTRKYLKETQDLMGGR